MQQSHGDDDLRCGPSVDNPCPPDLSTMLEDEEPSTLIHTHEEPKHQSQNPESNYENETKINGNSVVRRERPSRACTARSAARLYAAAEAEAALAAAVRRQKVARKERMREEPQPPSPPPPPQCKIITQLVAEPPPSQLPRWSLRSMWELASILNFLNVFRPFLNIKVEFSAEEFETALITPNNTLGDIHIPLLKVSALLSSNSFVF
ncbi:hypothetical protein CsSME_00006829 [Camellia sinensis var. sinensis]